MNRFALMLIVVALSRGIPSTQAAWTYGYPGRSWPVQAWAPQMPGQAGVWAGSRPGYWVPVRRIVPTASAGYPSYGYAYAPAGYVCVQPAYPPEAAPPYGFAPMPLAFPSDPAARMNAYPPPGYALPQQPYGAPGSSTAATHAATSSRTAPAKAADRENVNKRLEEELIQVKRERNQALAELSAWTSLGITPEQVRAFQDQLAKLQLANQLLVRRNSELQVNLSWFLGPERDVPMPADLAGKVLTVDPRFSFVVLNVGAEQGVAKNGKLLVNRNGKLVAKVRVSDVHRDSSIANIMPGWKLTEVMEGDEVIHQ